MHQAGLILTKGFLFCSTCCTGYELKTCAGADEEEIRKWSGSFSKKSKGVRVNSRMLVYYRSLSAGGLMSKYVVLKGRCQSGADAVFFVYHCRCLFDFQVALKKTTLEQNHLNLKTEHVLEKEGIKYVYIGYFVCFSHQKRLRGRHVFRHSLPDPWAYCCTLHGDRIVS